MRKTPILNSDPLTRQEIYAAGITPLDLAVAMGMSYSVLNQKRNGFMNWKKGELEACRAYLKKEAKRKI